MTLQCQSRGLCPTGRWPCSNCVDIRVDAPIQLTRDGQVKWEMPMVGTAIRLKVDHQPDVVELHGDEGIRAYLRAHREWATTQPMEI